MRAAEPLHHTSLTLRRPAVFAAGLVALALVSAVLVLAAVQAAGSDASGLRGDVPPASEVRRQLADLAELRTSGVGRVAALEADLVAARERLEGLDAAQQRLVAEIEELGRRAREIAVSAYVAGGPLGELRHLADVTEAADLSWRQYLLRHSAASADEYAARLRELRAEADDEVLDALDEIARLERRLGDLIVELDTLDSREAELEQLLVIAEAWDRAEEAIAEGPYGVAPPEKWAALRFCESSDNYRAVSPSGIYRGAYQFDRRTWRTVGGTGDPAAAPPAEQDARARELYARRGSQPWPICGRYLD